jgi:hypothetical protein
VIENERQIWIASVEIDMKGDTYKYSSAQVNQKEKSEKFFVIKIAT